MSESGPKRFDQILKKAEEDSQAFFSGAIILIVGILRAAYTFPTEGMDDALSWGWKVALFFGVLVPLLLHLWKTSRFAILKRYREAGALMTEALKGPVARELPFRHLWCMREIAWAEQLSQKRALPPAGSKEGFTPFGLVDASGEAILENTRIACAGCKRALNPWLPRELWAERASSKRAARVGEDLDAGGRCVSCQGAVGLFRTDLMGPVETQAP